MDVRLIEEYSLEDIKNNLNNCLPTGIRIYDVTEPVMKAGDIAFASFKIKITSDEFNSDKLLFFVNDLFEKDEILIEKKTKKKGIKEIDIKPFISDLKFERNIGCVNMSVVLPAGSTTNINPSLIQKAIQRYYNAEVHFDITKIDMFNSKMEVFK